MHYLSDYQTFNNTKELNEAVAQHLSRNKYELNETDRDILMMLSQYSVKYAGASHLKVATIAQAVKKSQITVRRVLRKLERLKIIERKPFIRKVSGGNGANVYIILPLNDKADATTRKEAAKPTQTTDEAKVVENEPFNSFKQNHKFFTETYLEPPYSHPYSRFKQAIYSFDPSQPLVSKLYGVYLSQTKELRKAYAGNELMDVALRAVRATFNASKVKQLRNLAGYFNGVLSNMLDDMGSALMAELFDAAEAGLA